MARHEAAHAVVAVRLDLPLLYTSIVPGGAGDDSISDDTRKTGRGGKLSTAGHTKLERYRLAQWKAALPDSNAYANLEMVSVETAAGVVAENNKGAALDHGGSHNDLVQLMQQASILLGVKFSLTDPPRVVTQWLTAQLNDASELLQADGGVAWDRVTAALLRKKHLSGDEVRVLVGQADAVSGFQRHS